VHAGTVEDYSNIKTFFVQAFFMWNYCDEEMLNALVEEQQMGI